MEIPLLLAQQSAVAVELTAAGAGKGFHQIGHGQLFLVFAADIQDDIARVHHDQPVAIGNRIAHVVRDHHSHQAVFAHNLIRQLQHLGRRVRIQRRRVLVQQQQLWLFQRGHQQRQCLTLAARQQPHLGGHAILQAQTQGLEPLAVLLALGSGDAQAQGAALASACDYSIATDAYLAEDYEQARALFAALGDYKESASLVTACDYAIAQNTYDAGEYAHAAELFTALGDYKNSAALAAQAGDRVFAEKLLGSWVSNEMDVSSIFIDSLYDAIDDDESSKALLDCMELGALPLKYTIEFTGEGTFLLAADSESAAAMIDTFYTAFTDGLTAYLEKEIEQDAANNGYTVEGLMQTYGCTTTRELIDAMLEMPLEDFMASLLPKETLKELLDSGTVNGVYAVKNGEIVLTIGKTQSSAVYDEAAGTLSVVDEDIAGTAIVFSRA